MSYFQNYNSRTVARTYDRKRHTAGADVMAGLLHIHCKKALKDVHILDAGCGSGSYAKALIDLGVGHVSMLDASAEMLAVAKEKLAKEIEANTVKDIIQAVLPEIPYKDGVFDAVILIAVLHHLDSGEDDGHFPSLEKTLSEAKRVLRPNGVIIATVCSKALFKESLWFTQILPELTSKVLKHIPTNKQYLELFSKYGFQCVSEINVLSGATPSPFCNYLDAEGPLDDAWRTGTSDFCLASRDEIAKIEQIIIDLKMNGSLEEFVKDHDRTGELGVFTMYACISV